MTVAEPVQAPRRSKGRNKGFDETHGELIEEAVRLISEKGAESLSIAALARAAGVNRTTVYYHFESRDALLAAVKLWASQQIVSAMRPGVPQEERIGSISRFVLDNPEITKLWIEDFVSPGDIRTSYPFWDSLVEGTAARFAEAFPDEEIDAEVYCVIMISSAIIGPRVFKNSVRPDASRDSIVERFLKEQQRTLRHDALLNP